MPQKPQSEMMHRPDKMAEEPEYVLLELKHAMKATAAILDAKLDQSKFTEFLIDYSKKVTEPNDQHTMQDIVVSLSVLASRLDKLTDALLILAERMDNNEVSGNKQAVQNEL